MRTTLPGRTPNRMLTLSTRRVIATNDGDPYLIRYTLIECRWFSIKVHHILRSDEDRCEHDHPWPFVSLILTGGYWEWVNGERTWCKPGRLLRRPVHWRHRLELPSPVWTIVVTGRKMRAWGFWTPCGWVPWRTYLKEEV